MSSYLVDILAVGFFALEWTVYAYMLERATYGHDSLSTRMGTRKVSLWPNQRGYRTRKGSLFGTGTIYEILTRHAYTGIRNFNEFARKSDGERKARSEIVEYEIPAIIDQATFEAVQALLVSRNPRSWGPRLSAAPSLLGGLVRCDCEESCALTTSSGTSRNGSIYAYYKCVQAIKQGRHKEGGRGPQGLPRQHCRCSDRFPRQNPNHRFER
jgi:hypothetical protein